MRSRSPKLGRRSARLDATLAKPAAMTQETRSRSTLAVTTARGSTSTPGRRWCAPSAPLARSTARPGASAGLGGFGGLFDLTRGRLSRSAAGRRDRRRRHQAAAGREARPARRRRHRSRRHVRQRSAGAGRAAAVLPRLLRHREARSGGRAGGDRGHRRGLPAGRLRADRRRDGRDAGPLPAGRLRPRRLRGRRGRAERGACRGADIGPGDVLLGLGIQRRSTPTASRWCARCCASRVCSSADPAPFAPGQTPGGGAAGADPHLRAQPARPARARAWSRRWPTSPAAACSSNVPRVLPEGVVARIDAGSWPAPPVFGWLDEAGRVTPTRCCGCSTAASAWCWWWRPKRPTPSRASPHRAGETVFRLGELSAGATGRARLAGRRQDALSAGRDRGPRAHCHPDLRPRLQPGGADRRAAAAADARAGSPW